MKYLKVFIIFILSIFSFLILFNIVGCIYAVITPKIDIKNTNKYYIYDINNKLIFNENENWINLEDMGENIINATLSVEDKNFYKHNGFDFARIVKAMLENIKEGEIVQGASTITQQYAKNLFLSFDKSWKRKWKEMWLTFNLEIHYSKDKILEGYLNTINYGNGVYGIGEAANYYFNKDVKDLSVAEAAVLAGIPNSPSNYSPIDNYEASKARQKTVLSRMTKNKYITNEESKKAYLEKLNLVGDLKEKYPNSTLYFKDAVIEELTRKNIIQKDFLDSGGLKIYTTLDLDAQKSLDKGALKNNINDEVQTAKVLLRSSDGAILGLVGGINYSSSQYNRAFYSKRQPGSTVKPFLYYKALENGFTPSTTFSSKPTTFNFENMPSYSPINAGNIYANKDISLIAAIAYSDNIYAIKTHLFLGQESLLEFLNELNITNIKEKNTSMPLGTYETNIIDISGAYASLSNGKYKVEPHLIRKVTNFNDATIYKFKNNKKNFLDPSISFIISELLTSTYDKNLIDYTYPTCINMLPLMTKKYAVKSGSTDTDAWVIGYTKDYVLASWAGYDDNKRIENEVVSSNKISWITTMEEYLKDKDNTWYNVPKNVSAVLVNPINGKIANNNDKNKKIVYYIKDTEPKK